jgi:hypothetical protein
MTWYVAHALMVLRPKVPMANPHFCWENLLLIEANENEDPWQIAEARAREDSQEEFSMQPPCPVPSRWEFAGIRKVIEVLHNVEDERFASGDQLTYNALLFDSPADLRSSWRVRNALFDTARNNRDSE